MNEFLIELAKHATWDRFIPFPEAFRRTSQPGTNHTKEEFDFFQQELQNDNKEAIEYVVNVDIGIVKHNEKSIHQNITEYEFQYDHIDNYKKNLKYPQRWYLFHGSPIGNWHSILRNGIKNMSGTKFMSTGQAWGPGVYASDDLKMAYGYGCSKVSKSTCVAVIELLVDPAQYKKTNGIYVIPDDKLLFPRYLFKMSSCPKSTGVEILEYYRKLRNGLIKPKPVINRLNYDKKELANCFIEEINKNTWLIIIGDTLCRLYVYNFPFTSPVLQLVNVTDDNHFDRYGCYVYNYNNWVPNRTLLSFITEVKSKINFATLYIRKEENDYLDV